MSAATLSIVRSRSRKWWIAAGLLAANEIRGCIVVFLVLRGWGYL